MIKQRKPRKAIEIDLKGPEGNAFYLLGIARNLATQLGYDKARQDELIADMTSNNYEHLVQVFDNHFGTFVVLYR